MYYYHINVVTISITTRLGSSIRFTFLKTKLKNKHTFSTAVIHALLCHTVASNRHSPGQKLKIGFCHCQIQYIHVTVYLTTQDQDKLKKNYTAKNKLTNCTTSFQQSIQHNIGQICIIITTHLYFLCCLKTMLQMPCSLGHRIFHTNREAQLQTGYHSVLNLLSSHLQTKKHKD